MNYSKESLNIFKTPLGHHLHIRKNGVVVIFNQNGEAIQFGKLARSRKEVVEELIRKGYTKIK